jgi:hypothetical protein
VSALPGVLNIRQVSVSRLSNILELRPAFHTLSVFLVQSLSVYKYYTPDIMCLFQQDCQCSGVNNGSQALRCIRVTLGPSSDNLNGFARKASTLRTSFYRFQQWRTQIA